MDKIVHDFRKLIITYLPSDSVLKLGRDIRDGKLDSHDGDGNDILKDNHKQEPGEPDVPELNIVLILLIPSHLVRVLIVWVSAESRL